MFVEDFVTLANPNATLQERNEATLSALSPFGKAGKGKKVAEALKDMEKGLEAAQDFNKYANKGKDAQKATQKEKEQLGEYVKNLDTDKVLTKNGAFRDAKRSTGIPNSSQHKKPVDVYDGTSENMRVYEFEVDGKKKYIIEHREDKFGRGPHFHGADDLKGSPLEKGRYNQYPGHSPEDFVGYKKKGHHEEGD
ncbi:HNH/endonuclease VII fold putative polymorphic toxin [Lysinibacillus sp. UGB7]|uniref:HNH/endonuclease VII fold putative polymorphic toxin n=1 Tax=Lysinibacillus sp. UGB7 TaxID=3411039 RepID=UPI003B7D4A4C